MRARFLIAIVGEDTAHPTPIDLVDYVIDWDHEPPVIAIKFCPFCGRPIDHDLEDLRVSE